jgi:hypothetical protein
MSYFDKKRHFYLIYIIDFQYNNNFKKNRVGILPGADSIFVIRLFFQVPFLECIKSL